MGKWVSTYTIHSYNPVGFSLGVLLHADDENHVHALLELPVRLRDNPNLQKHSQISSTLRFHAYTYAASYHIHAWILTIALLDGLRGADPGGLLGLRVLRVDDVYWFRFSFMNCAQFEVALASQVLLFLCEVLLWKRSLCFLVRVDTLCIRTRVLEASS